jgi:hypothetical protein
MGSKIAGGWMTAEFESAWVKCRLLLCLIADMIMNRVNKICRSLSCDVVFGCSKL